MRKEVQHILVISAAGWVNPETWTRLYFGLVNTGLPVIWEWQHLKSGEGLVDALWKAICSEEVPAEVELLQLGQEGKLCRKSTQLVVSEIDCMGWRSLLPDLFGGYCQVWIPQRNDSCLLPGLAPCLQQALDDSWTFRLMLMLYSLLFR